MAHRHTRPRAPHRVQRIELAGRRSYRWARWWVVASHDLGFAPGHDTDGHRPAGPGDRRSTSSSLGFHLLAQTPELKSLYIDCFFDRIAGEVMGRGLVRPDHPRNNPGTVVLRKFAPVDLTDGQGGG